MPFTLAHPAAVLPIHSKWKRWLPLAPLVVGSMIPDAAHYLPVPDHFRQNAHTLLGGLLFSVPAGIAVLLIFYWLAPELAFLLPSPHREALGRRIARPALSVRTAWLAVCGIAIGAETHVALDSFAHSNGWMVEHIRFLRQPIIRVHPYFALQLLSTVAGIAILLYVYDRWAMTEGFRVWTLREFSWRSLLWAGVFIGCLVPAIIESHTLRDIATFPSSRRFTVILTTSFIQNLLMAVCVVALCIKLFSRRSRLDAAFSSES
jgi:hypothetical protein